MYQVRGTTYKEPRDKKKEKKSGQISLRLGVFARVKKSSTPRNSAGQADRVFLCPIGREVYPDVTK
jgi:hypothetical protein